ncbi:hypothetical protein NKR19_g6561 [Coniochaeta hoffmannii]|uniref:Uncharacterized protein n=1 Tax=Coniochaeta hoffmannii TaxID=91930 RepID=A0AA38RQP4_9PEZI|nr:hypothetical protein NKR19_g6561 [Coniochaeta hoffmannii]
MRLSLAFEVSLLFLAALTASLPTASTQSITTRLPAANNQSIAAQLGWYPAPHNLSIMAHLEGLSPCYGKCIISEMHWRYTFHPLREEISHFCLWSEQWFKDHLNPCVHETCTGSRLERRAGKIWWGSHCKY